MPDLRLPSQLQGITAHWLVVVPNYTAWFGNRGTCVLTACPRLQSTAGRLGFEPATCWSQVRHPTATPPSHAHLVTYLFLIVLALAAAVKADMDTEAGEYGVRFEELLQRLDSGKIKLIDVREPSEVEETGSMPASINIPSNIALLFPELHGWINFPQPVGSVFLYIIWPLALLGSTGGPIWSLYLLTGFVWSRISIERLRERTAHNHEIEKITCKASDAAE